MSREEVERRVRCDTEGDVAGLRGGMGWDGGRWIGR